MIGAASGPSGPHVRAVRATCPGRPGHIGPGCQGHRTTCPGATCPGRPGHLPGPSGLKFAWAVRADVWAPDTSSNISHPDSQVTTLWKKLRLPRAVLFSDSGILEIIGVTLPVFLPKNRVRVDARAVTAVRAVQATCGPSRPRPGHRPRLLGHMSSASGPLSWPSEPCTGLRPVRAVGACVRTVRAMTCPGRPGHLSGPPGRVRAAFPRRVRAVTCLRAVRARCPAMSGLSGAACLGCPGQSSGRPGWGDQNDRCGGTKMTPLPHSDAANCWQSELQEGST